MQEKINITTIGGGTGTYQVLMGLKNNPHYNLAAIVSMSDNGGSSGILRDEFWILPPGDIRRAILALSEENKLVRKLFEYRFKENSSVGGHTIGNLLITAMTDITGNFEEGLNEICKMFRVHGKVIPVTLETTQLWVELENGMYIIGETAIDCPVHDGSIAIKKAFLTPPVSLNPQAKNVIENSDIIILCPWDLYTSLIPNLLVEGMKESLQKTQAKIIYFCNIMTKFWETTHFTVSDFVSVLETYIGSNVIQYVIVNNGEILPHIKEKYKTEENKEPVILRPNEPIMQKPIKIIERDVVNKKDYIRHDSKKIARIIEDIIQGWIK